MPDLAGRGRERAGPIAAGIFSKSEPAEIGAIERDGNVGIRGDERIVKNFDRWQTRDIFFQNSERLGVRLESVNLRGGKFFAKEQDRGADVAANIENDFGLESFRQIIFGFSAAPKQDL